MSAMPSVSLNNGVQMPLLRFGRMRTERLRSYLHQLSRRHPMAMKRLLAEPSSEVVYQEKNAS
jgi:hypothetical protein